MVASVDDTLIIFDWRNKSKWVKDIPVFLHKRKDFILDRSRQMIKIEVLAKNRFMLGFVILDVEVGVNCRRRMMFALAQEDTVNIRKT